MPLDLLDRLVAGLAETRRVLVIDGVSRFASRTTCDDTQRLTAFHDHARGRRLRWKCRARRYLDSGPQAFEVKLKGARGRTGKRRLECPPFPGEHPDAGARSFLDAALGEHGARPPEGPLLATVAIGHARVALAAPLLGERVTIDLGPTLGPRAAMRAGVAIVESESATGRGVADRVLLRDLGVRAVDGLSRYLLAVAATGLAPCPHDLRRLMRREIRVRSG